MRSVEKQLDRSQTGSRKSAMMLYLQSRQEMRRAYAVTVGHEAPGSILGISRKWNYKTPFPAFAARCWPAVH